MPPSLFTDSSPSDGFRPQLDTGTLWVAEIDGELAAFLAASPHGDRLHIDEFDVALGRQGQGIGTGMLADLIAWARTNGFARLSLTTFRNVPWNAPFYAAMGFVDWPADDAPASIRQHLLYENARGLKDRCAMRLDL